MTALYLTHEENVDFYTNVEFIACFTEHVMKDDEWQIYNLLIENYDSYFPLFSL